MKAQPQHPSTKLVGLVSSFLLCLATGPAVAQPHYVEVGVLAAPTAVERGEPFDASTGTLPSIIYWTHSGAGGNAHDVFSTPVAGDVNEQSHGTVSDVVQCCANLTVAFDTAWRI